MEHAVVTAATRDFGKTPVCLPLALGTLALLLSYKVCLEHKLCLLYHCVGEQGVKILL